MDKTLVLTEKQAKEQPDQIPAGYAPDVVISLALRISNVLYEQTKRQAGDKGYSSLAEYIKEAIREKVDREVTAEVELNMKRGFYR